MFRLFSQEIVRDYIHSNKIQANQFCDSKPGIVWLKNFMKRNRLSHKKVEMNSAAGKANTSNPFIIPDFYEQLAEIRSIILNIFSY